MVIKISLPQLQCRRKSELPRQFQVSWLSEKFVSSKEHRLVFCAALLLLAATALPSCISKLSYSTSTSLVLPHMGNQNVLKPLEAFFSGWKCLGDELVRQERPVGHKWSVLVVGRVKPPWELIATWDRGFSKQRCARRCSAGDINHVKWG